MKLDRGATTLVELLRLWKSDANRKKKHSCLLADFSGTGKREKGYFRLRFSGEGRQEGERREHRDQSNLTTSRKNAVDGTLDASSYEISQSSSNVLQSIGGGSDLSEGRETGR